MRRYQAFLATMLGLDAVGLWLGALLTPPDPVTQMFVLGPLLVAAPVVAYWLAYRGGFRRLGVADFGDSHDGARK